MTFSQRLEPITRYAIWEAHDRRCFYCGEFIRYRDMQVDHIIPQSLQGDDLHHFLESSGLDPEWDLYDLQNVVPSCASCNRNKRDRLALPRQIVLLTLTAKSRVSTIKKLTERFTREASGDKIRALIAYAMRGGEITADDLENAKHLTGDCSLVRLTTAVNFIDLAVSEVSANDIQRLRQETLANAHIQMQLSDGSRRTIATVAEYDDARANGGFPPTATDLRIEGIFKNASAILRAVSVAQPPEQSFVEQPHVGVCDLDLLPSSLLQHLGEGAPWDMLVSRYPTIGEFVRSKSAAIDDVSSSRVVLRPNNGVQTTISELVRADLDGDGIEDILVSVHGRAVGGSHAYTAEPVLLSRRSATGIFERSDIDQAGTTKSP